ncbi:GntR family transcriptional regulator [Clostridium transplantifaecale]|uniref:GntR family transcriptional regulator n=1 Tax=Clostridium transplantifaecale TaxID=2479838 RepID=UPI000F63EA85|nr:GntR family transcriptional regulator [Clostridium transplantifaecale]
MVQKAQPYKYQVYDEIKRGILKGQYMPGDVLTERKLSDEMGISRTPIREAMQMLAHDGWLVMETYKGAVVREFDLEYVLEVLKIRKSLEMLAVEDAVLNLTDRDLEELEEIAQCQRDMLNHYDEYDYIEMDRKFHQKIYELSHNRTLQGLLNNFNDIISFFGIRALKQKERKITTMEEHQKILDAVKRRDAGAAVRAMEDHMSKTFINIEGYMKERRNQ